MPNDQEAMLQRQQTTEIVAAYVRNHQLSGDQLSALISTVHAALVAKPFEPEPERTPAVPIRRSVHQDYVVCLDCGWRGKVLRRHIASQHQLDPTGYRARWSLSPEHPLTAPGYSERRSEYAKQAGLGRRPQTDAGTEGPETESAEAHALPQRKGRSSRRTRQQSTAQS